MLVGCGFVGMSFAYSLLSEKGIDELVLVDVNADKAKGEQMDLSDGLLYANTKMKITAGSYADAQDTNIVVLTAGAAQKPGQSRLDLVKINANITKGVCEELKKNNFNGLLVVANNPVDIMTEVTLKMSGFPKNRVFGTGTVLDSARFRSILGRHLGISPKSVHANVIGEHGDSEVSAFSVANIAESPLIEYYENQNCPNPRAHLEKLQNEVKNAAYEIISKKGATFYAIALSTAKIVETILNNQKSVLTVSTYIQNEFNGQIDEVYLSLPAIIGNDGVIKRLSLNYSYEEVLKLIESAKTLKKQYKELNI